MSVEYVEIAVIHNISRQRVYFLIEEIATERSFTNFGLLPQTAWVVPQAIVEVEAERLDMGQMENLVRLGLIRPIKIYVATVGTEPIPVLVDYEGADFEDGDFE